MASNPSFDNTTDGTKVASHYGSQVRNKTVIVTGVSKHGIGEGIARAFAHGGASTVIVTGRNDARLSTIVSELTRDFPSVKIKPHKLNHSSLEDTRRSAEELLKDDSVPKIDFVIANAGGGLQGPRTLTPDGLETNFQVNHVGHFLFITTLLPKLRIAAQGSAPGDTRVIAISSVGLNFSPMRFADYNFNGKPLPEEEAPNWDFIKQTFNIEKHEGYDPWVSYGQAKTANVLFAVHWNTLFAREGIYAFALHPGIVRTEKGETVFRALEEEQKKELPVQADKSLDQGASTAMVAALDSGLTPEKGVFLDDCQVKGIPEYASSKEKAERLWKLSEDIVAEKLGIAL